MFIRDLRKVLAFTWLSGCLARTCFFQNVLLRSKSTPSLRSTTSSSDPKRSRDRRTRRGGEQRTRRTQERSRLRRRRPSPYARPEDFDPKALTSVQSANENAPPFPLASFLNENAGTLRCVSDGDKLECETTQLVQQPAFEFYSLDDVFDIPGFSEKFNDNAKFRVELRDTMRRDIFDATPAYSNLSEKAATVLLLPDSSLQGSWRTPPTLKPRMNRLTKLLQKTFDAERLNGDELMHKIGAMCGPEPSTHWIDIVGVLDRKISHSWHQDTGALRDPKSKTVLWGFPAEDNYVGTGVFSHVIALEKECYAPHPSTSSTPRVEPVLFDGESSLFESHVIRPEYRPGREVLAYRDVDVLHSSPDVAYRCNLMRFM